jgi:hypothetical protein
MSRLSKFLFGFVLIVFLLACNFVTQPIRDVQDIAGTAQNFAETAQALGTAIPAGTLQALPSLAPTIEALASALPDFEPLFNPQGTPVAIWNEIPIMPQATAGQEVDATNYSFKATATVQEAQDFYNTQLPGLGWNSTFNVPVEDSGGLLVFQKESKILTITITGAESEVVVILTLP